MKVKDELKEMWEDSHLMFILFATIIGLTVLTIVIVVIIIILGLMGVIAMGGGEGFSHHGVFIGGHYY